MRINEFENSVALMRNQLLSKAILLAKNYDEAEDLTHDTIVKAIVYREKFRHEKSLLAWVYTIMKHQFINNRRRSQQLMKVLLEAERFDFPVVNGYEKATPSADSKIYIDELMSGIDKLDAKYKEPFVDFVSGYKYREISDKYKLPIGTIKSRIFYARKMIIKNLPIYSS